MITIEVKNKSFSGERCGIGFVEGVGKAESITPEQEKFFKEMGYKVSGKADKKDENKEGKADKKDEK